MGIALDRMEIEDVGANPVRLAEAIHNQLGALNGPIPVDEIARALDIIEIRAEFLTNIEGALITTRERNTGAILLNGKSNPQRRRFTLGHELGHFLNPWHQPTAPDGFYCSRDDMLASDGRSEDRYRRQEAEANLFSIELLTPRKRLAAFLRGEPDLDRVVAISDEFDVSREAAARRYVSLHDEIVAAVFSRDGHMRYAVRDDRFPRLAVRKDESVPNLPKSVGQLGLSPIEEVEADDWLIGLKDAQITIQTLHQQHGFATTLLWLASDNFDDEDPLEDSFERFSRFDG